MQGALLLVLFQASHTIEHKLTEQAQGNMEILVSQVPETASVVQLKANGEPDLSAPGTLPADQVAIGSHTLIMAGQQVSIADLQNSF